MAKTFVVDVAVVVEATSKADAICVVEQALYGHANALSVDAEVRHRLPVPRATARRGEGEGAANV